MRHTMRRKDKEINDRAVIDSIIRSARVCRLAMIDEDRPYVIPLSFGYSDNTLYFHSAQAGKKLECLKKNSNVCVEFDIDVEPIRADAACKWSMRYRSVIALGRASFLHNPEDKRRGLAAIAEHYGHCQDDVPADAVESLAVIKVTVDGVTGKSSGF